MPVLQDEIVEFDQAGEPMNDEEEGDNSDTKINMDEGSSEGGSEPKPSKSILRL